MKFALACATKVEEVRRDCGAARADVVRAPDRMIIVVADGAGGKAGAATAQYLCDAVVEQIGERGAPHSWSSWLAQLDGAMPRIGLAAAVIVEARGDGRIVGASAGNCQAWLFSECDSAELTNRQHIKPLLGEGRALPVGFEARATAAAIVIANDGLWRRQRAEQVAAAAAVRPLDDAVAALTRASRLRSGALRNDVAVAICQISRAR